MDPLADEFDNVSPYNYGMNNPILMVDPTGMAADSGFLHQAIEEVQVWLKRPATGALKKIGDLAGRNVYGDQGGGELSQTRADALIAYWIYAMKVMAQSQYGKPGTPLPREVGKMLPTANVYAKATKGGIEAANGIKITGFTIHGVDRAIGSFGRSGVKPNAILDAMKNPLKINNVVTDQLGRQSQRFISQFGEVVVNPPTGKIISVNPTSSSKAAKLLKQLGQ